MQLIKYYMDPSLIIIIIINMIITYELINFKLFNNTDMQSHD